jgi:cob(I)alamin adenosyltransferase
VPVNLTRIYTRHGDGGETHLGDMSRVPKTHPRIEAYGDVDELNAQLGVALATDGLPDAYAGWLRRIQNDLFDVGADLAVPPGGERDRLRVSAAQVTWLEERCDEVNDTLEPLRSFLLPGGTKAAAQLHVCRTVCRRAERRVLQVQDATSTASRTCSSSSPAARTTATSRSGSRARGGALGSGERPCQDVAQRRGVLLRQRGQPSGRVGHDLGDLALHAPAALGDGERLDPPVVRRRAALDEAGGLEPVGDPRDVRVVAAQPLGERAHRHRVAVAQLEQRHRLRRIEPHLAQAGDELRAPAPHEAAHEHPGLG